MSRKTPGPIYSLSMPTPRIVDLGTADSSVRYQAAEVLVEAFPHANGWPTIEDATNEVTDLLTPERRCRAALDGDDQLAGWIAATPGYRGRVWELHPLVVRGSARGQGIGLQLVRDLERLLVAEGALTLWVGTDDDLGETSVAHLNLYPEPLAHLRGVRFAPSHPLGFYLRAGFALSGVVPDANGRGLPGILLSKRIG